MPWSGWFTKQLKAPAKQQEEKVGRMGRTLCPGRNYLSLQDDIPAWEFLGRWWLKSSENLSAIFLHVPLCIVQMEYENNGTYDIFICCSYSCTLRYIKMFWTEMGKLKMPGHSFCLSRTENRNVPMKLSCQYKMIVKASWRDSWCKDNNDEALSDAIILYNNCRDAM